MIPISAAACSCGVNDGDTVVQLKILTDRQNAKELTVKNGSGQRQKFLKYQVAVLTTKRGQFEYNHILTGRGGGDCGIKFMQGDIVTFRFWAKSSAHPPILGFCDLAKDS